MKKIILAAMLLVPISGHALAQTATTDTETPAIATPDTTNSTAPVRGENSFTEAQAQERIAEAGFTSVSALKIDDMGVWRGTAMKNGMSQPVGLDYQGNVVSQ